MPNSLICLPRNLPLSVTVDVKLPRCDNLLLFTPSPLTVAEGGSGSYTVALASQPSTAVTVTVSAGAGVTLDTDAATNGNQTSLSFSTANWNTPQTVEVSVGQDVDDTVILYHSASGGNYGSVTANLTVNIQNICEYMDALNSDGTFCDLDSKKITSLNSGNFNGLSNLETLWLGANDLRSLPEDIFAGLSSLKTLSLRFANLSSLPEDIFAELLALEELYLNSNALSSLPKDIFAGLSNLKIIWLNDNKLSSLPEDIFDEFSALETLYLNRNALSSLPEDIFAGLSALQELRLDGNDLSSLPEDIFDELSALETLTLNENSLTCLPESLPLSVDVDVDLPQCVNTNTTAALPSWLIATATLEPLTLYVGGEDGSRDGSDAFNMTSVNAGDITWRFTSSHPAVASVSEEPSNNPIVMVTPVREGKATITVTATAANGNRIS
ncbi:MAG: hypothetical protein ERJ67_07780, partial [Aphanocapsa feldmannii 277cV]